MTERISKENVLSRLDQAGYFASEVEGLVHLKGDEHQALCPFHKDSNPSLSINVATGKWFCHGCNAKGDLFTFYMKKHSVTFQTAISELARRAGLNGGNGSSGQQQNRQAKSGPGSEKAKRPKARAIPENLVAEYPYLDEAGRALYSVRRFEQAGCDKTFAQGRHEGEKWVSGLPKDVRLVPYHLPEILKAEQVLVCEGEKCADALSKIGFAATCNAMGAGKWKGEYSVHFKDKLVIILPDNDEPGRKHAAQVRNSLLPHAKGVKIVELPGLPRKGRCRRLVGGRRHGKGSH